MFEWFIYAQNISSSIVHSSKIRPSKQTIETYSWSTYNLQSIHLLKTHSNIKTRFVKKIQIFTILDVRQPFQVEPTGCGAAQNFAEKENINVDGLPQNWNQAVSPLDSRLAQERGMFRKPCIFNVSSTLKLFLETLLRPTASHVFKWKSRQLFVIGSIIQTNTILVVSNCLSSVIKYIWFTKKTLCTFFKETCISMVIFCSTRPQERSQDIPPPNRNYAF